jgi:hypothetical protein
MPEQKDPEIAAVEAVHKALKGLDADSRIRVLGSVYALLQIQMPTWPKPDTDKERPRTADLSSRALPTARPLSLVELFQDKKPGTNAQKIALFAYYREKHEGLSRFARGDLESYFAKARLAPPTNYDRDFVTAVKQGWVHEAGDESYITSKGIEAVEAGFPVERRSGMTSGAKASRRKVPKSKVTRR